MSEQTALVTAALAPADLTGPLEPYGPRVGADRGDPHTSGRVLHQGDGVETGLWECTPGSWVVTDRPDTETVHILTGRGRLTTHADGSVVELEPGTVAVLPKGWTGRWEITQTLRKLYVTAV